VSLAMMLDCAADLDAYAVEVQAALALCGRIGYEHAAATFLAYRQFIRAMRGETAEPGGFTDDTFDEQAHAAAQNANPAAAVNFHIVRAVSAAVFGDGAALDRHVAALLPALPSVPAVYGNATGHAMAALSAAGRAETPPGPSRTRPWPSWTAAGNSWPRGPADQPGNFRHLLHLAEAERAWATGDFAIASAGFDAAPATRPAPAGRGTRR